MQGEVVLLATNHLTLQTTGYQPEQVVPVQIMLSNWTYDGYPAWGAGAAEVVWDMSMDTEGTGTRVLSRGSRAVGAGTAVQVPQGWTGEVLNISLAMPPSATVATHTTIILSTSLRISNKSVASNSWRLPLFPNMGTCAGTGAYTGTRTDARAKANTDTAKPNKAATTTRSQGAGQGTGDGTDDGTGTKERIGAPPLATHPCTLPIYADAKFLAAVKAFCPNTLEIPAAPAPFVPPPGRAPFVVVTDTLRQVIHTL